MDEENHTDIYLCRETIPALIEPPVMRFSTGQRLIPCSLAVLAFVNPLLAHGSDGNLVPVIDVNPRHSEAASRPLREPSALIVAAEAVPLSLATAAPAVPLVKARHNASSVSNQPQRQSAVRFAVPFDPTKQTRPRREYQLAQERTSAVTPAPVVRAHEPIRPASQTGVHDSNIAADEVPSASKRRAAQSAVDARPFNANSPQLSGFLRIVELDPTSRQSDLKKLTHRPSTIVERAINPSVRRSPPCALPSAPTVSSLPAAALKLAEEALPERSAARHAPRVAPVLAQPVKPVVRFAETEPLLAILQPAPSASDLPAPDESARTAEQMTEAEQIEAFELDLKPISALSARTKPEAGELPTNYAAARFAREGEVAHRMGFSRSTTETEMMWEAPAICHRPLYFEDINLERHGTKVPLIQPAISAAHFFGRVPLVPYMMISEGHRNCQYTLGHYRPGDYAPYSLYIPRFRLDASAAEAAVVAGVFLAFP